ncbi:MAG: hypothetical protein ACREVM_06515, partial [Burkholderiales bacterium]
SSDSWMSHTAKNEIYFGRPLSIDEITQGIRSVSRDDIVELSASVLRPEGMALTLLGDIEKKKLELSLAIQ